MFFFVKILFTSYFPVLQELQNDSPGEQVIWFSLALNLNLISADIHVLIVHTNTCFILSQTHYSNKYNLYASDFSFNSIVSRYSTVSV